MSSTPCRSFLPLFALLALLVLPTAAGADLSERYGRLPLHFEENRGQADQEVRFLTRGPGYGLYLTASDAVLVLGAKDQSVLRMVLVGANPDTQVSGLDELSGKANYLIGKDPARWRTNVPTYAKVRYREVYPGIDLVYYGNQRQLEYDFVIAPGADPKRIALRFDGADKLEVNARGDLVLHVARGDVRVKKPVVYQDIDGKRHGIDGRYVVRDANRVSFQLAAYDGTKALVIDPVLAYSTHLGGSGYESPGTLGGGWFIGIAVDSAGSVYVTGATSSHDFPTTQGAFQTSLRRDLRHNAFVSKIDPTGSRLVYSTYLGGYYGNDQGSSIAVDAAGNAYLTGSTTSADFPTTLWGVKNGYLPTDPGDAFVTKLNPSGSQLVYSTLLGGDSTDLGIGIAVDHGGNAFVTGQTRSYNFPTTLGAFRTAFNGAPGFSTDAFVTKLNPIGSTPLAYSTFLGGTGDDQGSGIAVDKDGNIYVTGVTASPNFPVTSHAFQVAAGGNGDAFVTKLNPGGGGAGDLVYSSYLGGDGFDDGLGIAVGGSPVANIYVTGYTDSSNFPTTTGALQATPGGNQDAFITRINPGSVELVYSTYLGGSSDDRGYKIALDALPSPNVYVTGSTASTDFPISGGAIQTTLAGSIDAFVTKLDASGSAPIYSTYLGGGGNDQGYGIAVDTFCRAHVTGITLSFDFPTTAGAFQTTPGGGQDVFVARIADDAPACTGTRYEEDAASYQGYWPTYGPETGTFSGGAIRATNQGTATATFAFTGIEVSWIGVKCNVCGIATVQIDGGAPAVVDTFGPGEPGSLVSEPVFTASGLAPGTTHTLTIVVTGAGAAVPGFLSGSAHVAVDAFDVTK